MAHPPGHLHVVALDLHPPTAPVAELAAGKIAIDRFALDRKTRWEALEDAGQARAMGFTGSGQTQRHLALKVTGGGCGGSVAAGDDGGHVTAIGRNERQMDRYRDVP